MVLGGRTVVIKAIQIIFVERFVVMIIKPKILNACRNVAHLLSDYTLLGVSLGMENVTV